MQTKESSDLAYARRLRLKAQKMLEAAAMIESFAAIDEDVHQRIECDSAHEPNDYPEQRPRRVQQVIDFMRGKPHVKPKDIVEACGIPRGSLGGVLGRPEFKNLGRGEWTLSDAFRS